MTSETIPTFIESIENINTDDKYNYLLNFWYTAKLNKELEYVKRHGIHPTLAFYDNDLANSFEISSKSPISTAFYTVFRIYLEKAFPGWKFLKDKYQEKWEGLWEDENEYSLDNPTYLKMAYAASNNFRSGLGIFSYTNRTRIHFSINIYEKNSLYVKNIINEMAQINDYCAKEIDTTLPVACDKLFNKLQDYIELPQDTTVKKKKEEAIIAPPRVRTMAPQQSTLEFQQLIELYDKIEGSIPPGFDDRTKFTFLLSFATSSGLPSVSNTEDNFRTFFRLKTNTERRAA